MPESTNFSPNVCFDNTVTITSGQTQSGAVDLDGTTLCGLLLPSTFDGTTITFQTSDTLAGTYVDIQDGTGASASVTCAASKYIALDPLAFAGIRFLKLTAGTSQSTTDTIIILATRPL